jgi:hypothetical protein
VGLGMLRLSMLEWTVGTGGCFASQLCVGGVVEAVNKTQVCIYALY